MENNKFELSYQKVMDYMFEHNFSSFDPYDGLNSDHSFLKSTKLNRLGLVYLNKFSPFNLRRLFKVEKSRQLMTLGTVGNAILLLNEMDSREMDSRGMDFGNKLYEEIKNQSLKQMYGYHCWDSRKFPIQMLDKLNPVNVPDLIGNEIIGTFLINYFKNTGNKEALIYIKDLADFILNKFYSEREGYSFFRYRITDPDDRFTLNASMKAMAYLLKVPSIVRKSYDEIITKIISTVLKLQKENGSWNYTFYMDTHTEKNQIDFHQGFILDEILLFLNEYGYKNPYSESYRRGLNFYYREQFQPNGQSIYRYPKKWPIDIHNQAQGIITFTRASIAGFGEHFLDFACTIAEWTINNMQDEDGHFYFLKYPYFINKIPYIRWSDANMAYALSILIAGLNHFKQKSRLV